MLNYKQDCHIQDLDQQRVMLRVDGEWVMYTGSTSLRKLYYRAYEMVRFNSSNFYVHEYDRAKVDAAIFPDRFWVNLSCCEMDGIPVEHLPTRLFAKRKMCKKVKLGNGCGTVCTFCGRSGIK